MNDLDALTTTRAWTRSRKPFNEDAVSAGPGWVCVVDGATPLGSDPDGNRKTSAFASRLAGAVGPGLTPGNITEHLRAALQHAQDGGQHGATATIAAAAWDGDTVATAIMGDSLILLELKSGETEDLQDPAFEGREARLLAPVIDAMAAGLAPGDAYAAAVPVLRSEREKRNTEAGVWVMSDSTAPADAAAHLSVRTFPRETVHRIAAVTDGMWRAVELFGITTPAGLLDAAQNDAVDPVLDALVQAEAADPDRSSYPRFSFADDAALAFAAL